ncbi:hypothetical protein ACLOJK_030564 [Asimina triloba]
MTNLRQVAIEGLLSGAPIQRLEFNFTKGNLWQVSEQKEDDARGEIRTQWNSGLQNGLDIWVALGSSLVQVVHKDNDKLNLDISLIGFIPGSLTKDTIPCRQKGHGIEPAGLGAAVNEVLLVEHR